MSTWASGRTPAAMVMSAALTESSGNSRSTPSRSSARLYAPPRLSAVVEGSDPVVEAVDQRLHALLHPRVIIALVPHTGEKIVPADVPGEAAVAAELPRKRLGEERIARGPPGGSRSGRLKGLKIVKSK